MVLKRGGFKFRVLALLGAIALSAGSALALPVPNWTAIFDPSGAIIDLNGGLDAVFAEDWISTGSAVDMSVLPESGNPNLVNNGIIDPANDLGNGYVWITADNSGHPLLYAGVERFASTADTFVRFEFYQANRDTGAGVPWYLSGGPTVGDLLVQVNFKAGQPSSTEFSCWDGEKYVTRATSSSNACGSGDQWSCNGPLVLQSTYGESWDQADNLVEVPAPDSFLQFGVDLASLPGCQSNFTSIIFRTPQDISINYFRRIGYWAGFHRAGTE